MFSVQQKREIADAVQKILHATNHPELPYGEITFDLTVVGASPFSWAMIQNNSRVPNPSVNPHNERQDPRNHPTQSNVSPSPSPEGEGSAPARGEGAKSSFSDPFVHSPLSINLPPYTHEKSPQRLPPLR